MFSFSHSYYVSIFTIYYPSDAVLSNIETIILAVCVPVAAVIIIAPFVVLFKIQIKNEVSEIHELGDFGNKDFETTEAFDLNFSDTKIEEDPFA